MNAKPSVTIPATAADHPPELGDELDAAEIARRLVHGATADPDIAGMANEAAVQACDIAVLAVPYGAQLDTLEPLKDALAGKILIDVTVPLVPPRVGRVQLPAGGSAVQAAQDMLGETVQVVSAFQNIAAQQLADPDHAIECDVLVCGNDPEALFA